MTREERNTKLKHFITCLKCGVKGRECDDNCPVQYEAGNTGEIIENLEAISKALEQEPHWIPCSERLPEVGSEVLVCYDFKGKKSVYIADFYGDGDFHGLDDEYLTAECRKNRKAVAWMPLPDPYKAESEW